MQGCHLAAAAVFRSTPPREGRRDNAATGIQQISFSIHAPTRGATAAAVDDPRLHKVSIRAPTRGATARHRKFKA